jgi:hypothetical protein
VSSFRPAAKVASPDGREWEIYAYKLKVGAADELGPDENDLLAGTRGGLVDSAVVLVVTAVLLIPRLLLKLAQVAVAGLRALRSDEWTVDAICYLPGETVLRWTTTCEHKGQVLAQVEGHLARGDVPQHLRNAVYRGEVSRSAR